MTRFDAGDPALSAAGRAAFPGFRLHAVARTPSTQDLGRAAVRAGAAPGWCVVAEEQTAGRGRQGRAWTAPAGAALLVSIVLRCRGPLGWLSLGAGVAVAEAIEGVSGVTPRLKWPNDVLDAAGGKLAGLLAEVAAAPYSETGSAVVLGVGVNVAVDTFPEGVRGSSLHRLGAGPSPSREALLGAILTALARRAAQVDGGEIAAVERAWLDRAAGIGETVVVDGPAGRVSGVALGVDGDGALLLRTSEQTLHLLAADVHLYAGGKPPEDPPDAGARVS
jgi:BirA family biotin operon repressor/biotin-[acetyl-CoA-carboxylase] ligase